MKRGNIMFTVDEHNRWFVFDRSNALGEFGSWAEADALRNKLTEGAQSDDGAPAWTPKSGGY